MKLSKSQKETAMQIYNSRYYYRYFFPLKKIIKCSFCFETKLQHNYLFKETELKLLCNDCWRKTDEFKQEIEKWLTEFAKIELEAKEQLDKERKEFKSRYGVYPEQYNPNK